MKYAVILLFIAVISCPVYAQLDNSSFEWPSAVITADSGRLYGGFRTLGYIRNNEYFNEILDGYTLFGYQLNPYLAWQPGRKVRIEGGVYLTSSFGENDFSEVLPTFTISYADGGHQLNFGTLEGNLAHRLIEPLYDFENALSEERIENGIQYRFMNDNLFLDTWLDWRNALEFGENEQEELWAGISAEYAWLNIEKVGISTLLQLSVWHRGGQIDVSGDPLQTYINSAFGLRGWIRPEGFIKLLRSDIYYTSFTDNSGVSEIPFDSGSGIYANLYLVSKLDLGLMVSYWEADEFYSPVGGRLYQTYSYVPERFGQAANQRELLFLRFMYDHELGDGLQLTARAEPYIDLNGGDTEWSLGLYLNYRFQTGIGKK